MKYFDAGTITVIAVTFALFALALFFTGPTHNLLLEAGVFLVSVKLILMGYKTSAASQDLHRELEEIKALLKNSMEKP